MLAAEALGVDQFRDRVKIYATDVDQEALARARQAAYSSHDVQRIPQPMREKYFEANGGHYVFRKDLRHSVIFGRHDLIQDAPISRIDLLSCRNTLMYLNTETQARILERFHFAINERGFLFLGKAETLLTYSNAFTPIDLKRRIFAKSTRDNLRNRPMFVPRNGVDEAGDRLPTHARIREAAFDAGPIAQIVVDVHGMLAMANDRARNLFNLAPGDLSRPVQDLQLSYRPLELRSCIDRAYAERQAVMIKDVDWTSNPGESRHFEVHVIPLMDAAGFVLGAYIGFQDTTATKRIAFDHERTIHELESAYEELQSTNEELETMNEELQSTNEELETTGEELQSTNEELETMNEELQSINEELETVNEEVRRRSDELKRLNMFLESILASLRAAVVVVDADLLVLIWNPKAENLWGLRTDEALGKNILNLEIGLPVERLKPTMRSCLAGEATYLEMVVDAVNRRGTPITCHVTCTPMTDGDAIRGVILVMDDDAAAVDGQVEPRTSRSSDEGGPLPGA